MGLLVTGSFNLRIGTSSSLFEVWGSGFKAWVLGSGFRVWGLGFKVQGLGFRALGIRVLSFEWRLRVQGLELRI